MLTSSFCALPQNFSPRYSHPLQFAANIDVNGQGRPVHTTIYPKDKDHPVPRLVISLGGDQRTDIRLIMKLTTTTMNLFYVGINRVVPKHPDQNSYGDVRIGGRDDLCWSYCGDVNSKDTKLLETSWHVSIDSDVIFIISVIMDHNVPTVPAVLPVVSIVPVQTAVVRRQKRKAVMETEVKKNRGTRASMRTLYK
jgi:hypothetical protein